MSTIKVDNIEAKTGAGDITIASALSGAATKFKISGGSANYILSTDGSAGLSWIANDQGDITGVTAGNGITVAAPTGPVPTVTVGQGTGITVNTNDIEVTGYASLIVSIWFFSGLIISLIGIVGLYVGKTFESAKGRPTFLIRSTKNI